MCFLCRPASSKTREKWEAHLRGGTVTQRRRAAYSLGFFDAARGRAVLRSLLEEPQPAPTRTVLRGLLIHVADGSMARELMRDHDADLSKLHAGALVALHEDLLEVIEALSEAEAAARLEQLGFLAGRFSDPPPDHVPLTERHNQIVNDLTRESLRALRERILDRVYDNPRQAGLRPRVQTDLIVLGSTRAKRWLVEQWLMGELDVLDAVRPFLEWEGRPPSLVALMGGSLLKRIVERDPAVAEKVGPAWTAIQRRREVLGANTTEFALRLLDDSRFSKQWTSAARYLLELGTWGADEVLARADRLDSLVLLTAAMRVLPDRAFERLAPHFERIWAAIPSRPEGLLDERFVELVVATGERSPRAAIAAYERLSALGRTAPAVTARLRRVLIEALVSAERAGDSVRRDALLTACEDTPDLEFASMLSNFSSITMASLTKACTGLGRGVAGQESSQRRRRSDPTEETFG